MVFYSASVNGDAGADAGADAGIIKPEWEQSIWRWRVQDFLAAVFFPLLFLFAARIRNESLCAIQNSHVTDTGSGRTMRVCLGQTRCFVGSLQCV